MHKEVTMSRRSALMAIPAMGATVLSFPAAAAAASARSTILELIEAHRAAHTAFEDICDVQDAASSAYKVPFKLVPVFTNRNGKAVQYWEFSSYPGRTEDEIRKMHAKMREHHCGKAAAAVHPPASIAAASWAITVSLRRCLKAYRDAVAWELQYREDSGYAAVERDYAAASSAEREALLVLCAAPCQTAADAQMKGEYLATFFKRNSVDEDHVDALLASLAGVPQAA